MDAGAVVGDDRTEGTDDTFASDVDAVLDTDHLDLRRLVDPQTLRTLIAVVLALVLVLRTSDSDGDLVVITGIGTLAYGATSAWRHLRTHPRPWVSFGVALAMAGVGLGMALRPNLSLEVAGRLLAALLAAGALVELYGARGRRTAMGIAWPLAKAVTALTVALFVWVSPDRLFEFVVTSFALVVAVVGIIAVCRSVAGDGDDDTGLIETGRGLVDRLVEHPQSDVDRAELMGPLFFEGPEVSARLTRFFVLMSLSAVIAAGGVVTDSTATVIGAMLVAPLMTPLMAAAISIVMGWPNRLGRSSLIVLGGVLLVVLIGLVIGHLAPVTLDPATNTQILSRSSPTIPDLMIAIAAGAAGAFALSRPDVSGALPGVAVAISLVPPLSVVGISFATGAGDDGIGALLLFASNALAIVIVGGVTFVLTGLTPIHAARSNQQRVRTASAALMALAVFVVAALALNGREISQNAIEAGRANTAVVSWLGDARDDFTIQGVDVDGDTVTVTIIGPPDDAPSTASLQEELSDAFGRAVTANLQVRVQTSEVVEP